MAETSYIWIGLFIVFICLFVVCAITKSKNLFYISFLLTMFYGGCISAYGYMWYIPTMILSIGLIMLIYKYIKTQKSFIIVLCVLIVVCYSLYFAPIGLNRGVGGLSLGILASFIPKIKLNKKFNWNIIFVILVFAAIVALAYLPKTMLSKLVLILLLFPALLYFTNQVPFSNKFCNWLGSISFSLYAYQTIMKFFRRYGLITQNLWLFIVLIILVLLDCLIKYLIKKRRTEKTIQEQNL